EETLARRVQGPAWPRLWRDCPRRLLAFAPMSYAARPGKKKGAVQHRAQKGLGGP
ncbi:MAG: hypothetical protein RL669_1959, partial [Pseudomonadota bacterium]